MSHSKHDSFNQSCEEVKHDLNEWSQIKVQIEHSHEVLSILYESVLLLRNQFTADSIGEELWHKIASKILKVFHEKYDEIIMIIRQYISDMLKMDAVLNTMTIDISSVLYEGFILLNKRSQYELHDNLMDWSIQAFEHFNTLIHCIEYYMKLLHEKELDLKTIINNDLEDSMPSNSVSWLDAVTVVLEQTQASDSASGIQ